LKKLILILLFLSLTTSLFAYPVSEDLFLSVKNYGDNLSDKIHDFHYKLASISDSSEHTVFIVLMDCLILCREMLNSLSYLLAVDTPQHLDIYCNERLAVIDEYITLLKSANMKDKHSLDITLKVLANTRQALKRVLSEINTPTST